MSPILKGIVASGISGHLNTAGAWDSIASYNAGATGAITFSSIPQTYKSLRLVVRLRDQRTVASYSSASLSFNGSPTGSAYAYQSIFGDERIAGPFEDSSSATNSIPLSIAGASGYISNGSVYGFGIFDIENYSSTTKYKNVKGWSGYTDPTNSYSIPSSMNFLTAGQWGVQATAISSIVLTASNPNFAGSVRASLYGLKG
jgi:hypothetical protein